MGLTHRFGFIDVNDDNLRAAFLSCANRVGHDVDLGGDRVRTPNHHAIRLRHFPWVSAKQPTGSGNISGPGDPDADCPVEARVALGVGEALDSIAHHETHRARVKVRPHALGSEFALDRQEVVSDPVERLLPTNRCELVASLGANASKRLGQPIRVMDALPIASDFGADDAGCVGLIPRAMDAADALAPDHLDVESTNRGAVVRTDGGTPRNLGDRVHEPPTIVTLRTARTGCDTIALRPLIEGLALGPQAPLAFATRYNY